MADAAALPPRGVSRRDFLKRAAIGAAAAAGLGAALQQKAFGRPVAVSPVQLPEDSIFAPREDQRARVLGK